MKKPHVNVDDDFDTEIERWHRVSDGAIGNKYILLEIFLATTPTELREQLREQLSGSIISGAEKC